MANTFDHGYALLIGVGTCAYTAWSLPVTVKDMGALRGVLADPTLCAYPDDADHLRLLHDAGATRADILDGLAWLAERTAADPDATAIVYYSGHGLVDKASSCYYLIPHDVQPFDIPGSALPTDDFHAALRKVNARRLLVVIDACHAEGMATAKDQPAFALPKGFEQEAPSKGLVDALKEGEGRAVFTSSRGTQSSWIRPDGAMSIYTYHLIEALHGAAAQLGDTTVTVGQLQHHLGRTVPESARAMWKQEQTPFFDTATEDFPVALLRGGKGLPAGGWQAVEPSTAPRPRTSIKAKGNRNVVSGGDMRGNVIVTGDNANIRRGDDQDE
ncbi:MAG: caspase family protein [Anaerolineae bacterium]